MSKSKCRNVLFSIFTSVLAVHIQAALYITEIHFHPLEAIVAGEAVDGDLFEFIELKNTGDETIVLSGYMFTDGITYTFPTGATIAPDDFIVLASNEANFNSRYGFMPYGQFSGNLKNSGEKVTLSNASRVTVDEVNYKETSPWPVEPDGSGNSLVAVDPDRSGDPDLFSTWRASSKINGSPGTDDPEISSPRILINEVMTHTDLPQSDYIELYNSTSVDADISGWFLTDNSKKPKKFQIPANTTIPPNGYVLFTADDFNANESDSTGFNLDSHGEEAFIFAADAEGNLTGYNHGFTFGEIENGISFGRYVTSTLETHFVAQAIATPGAVNSGPLIGKVIITEIMYSGIDEVEFLELQNISNDTIALYDTENSSNMWKVDGIGFEFPSVTKMNPGQTILLIDDTVSIDVFRTKFDISDEVPIFRYPNTLQGNGETIKLEKAEPPYIDQDLVTIVPYMLIDWVTYGSSLPWPEDADGSGKSLHRIKSNAYGNDPANWESGDPTPGSHTTSILSRHGKINARKQVALTANRKNRTYSLSIFLPKEKMVSIDLYDCTGRLCTRLGKQLLGPGLHFREFSASSTGSNNMLILRVNAAGSNLFTGKVMLLN